MWQEAHLAKIKTLFSKFGGTGSGAEETDFITFPMFEEKINTPEVRDYFESLRLATRLDYMKGCWEHEREVYESWFMITVIDK